jgi:hypothetical protein
MRRVLALLVVVAVLAPAVTPAVVGAQADGPAEAGQNNSTVVRHEDPQAGLERGNLRALRAHLERRMTTVLVDCTEGLAAAADACDRIDEEYEDSFEKYVDLRGRERNTTETYREARTSQEEYADTLREFRETRAAYREARRNGDRERARRLARKLQRLAAELESVSVELIDEYETIGNATGVNVSNATDSVRETNDGAQSLTIRIARDVFEPATVTARTLAASGSFLEPLAVVGRVTSDGTAVGDARVAVDLGRRTVRTRTNASGWYRLDYRPTTAPAGQQVLRVRYLPRSAAPYLGANTTAPVVVEQVTPTVSVATTGPFRFGENATVAGRVVAGGLGAPGVPVVVTVGETRLGRVRTDGDGRFGLAEPLPRSVETGDRPVRARVALDGRALAGTSTVTDVRVARTETVLDLNATRPGAVRVSGRLRTASGRPVADAPVALRLDGERSATVTTSDDGAFTATLDPSVGSPGSLTARYDGAGNLAPTTARASIPARPEAGAWLDGVSLVAGVAAVLVLGLLGALVVRRRRNDAGTGTGPGPALGSESPASGSAPVSGAPRPSEESVLLARARDLAEDGATVAAIGTAYAAVRASLGEEGPRTHWEFFRDRRDGLDPERATALRRLTEQYEAATFAGRSSTDTLETALAAAARLVDADARDGTAGGGGAAGGTD